MPGIDSYTKLMLHMNSDFSDSSASGHTPTVNGATIDTSIKKFGAGSGKFVSASSQYVSYAYSSDWSFGTGDFTIDAWIKRTTTGILQRVFGQTNSVAANASVSGLFLFNADDTVTCYFYKGGGPLVNLSSTGTVDDTDWHHFAIVRYGNDLKLYIGGVNDGTYDVTGLNLSPIAEAPFSLGRFGAWDTVYFNGHIDEFRISKGTARWTSNFTPPASEYTEDIITPDIWQPEIQQPYKEKIEVVNYN